MHWSLKKIYQLVGAMMLMTPLSVRALPTGGEVKAGDAIITKLQNIVNVDQNSDKAIIDWESFNIEKNEQVNFMHPSSKSIILNRINDKQVTNIEGILKSNGKVILVNQNGIIFGKDAQVDVSSLIATSSDIRNENFMSDNFLFDKNGNINAFINNSGNITVKEAGLVGLVAPNIENSGIIKVNLGKVYLASGDMTTVDFYGDRLLEFSINDNIKSSVINNSGTIESNGGKIFITADSGKNIIDSLINNKGKLEAKSFIKTNGEIVISSTRKDLGINSKVTMGKVEIKGIVDVSGNNINEDAGSILITGEKVLIKDETNILAVGYNNGGRIFLGGEYKGLGKTPTAEELFLDKNVNINASSLYDGNGGKIIAWSNQATSIKGVLRAKGGENLGGGGFIETSSARSILQFPNPPPDVSAVAINGKNGKWLIDPGDLTISDDVDNNINDSSPYFATDVGSVLSTATLNSALDLGTNIEIATSDDGIDGNGDITVIGGISTSGTGSLTLNAYRSVYINAPISLNAPLTIISNNNASNNGGKISVANNLSTNGYDIILGGPNSVAGDVQSPGSGFSMGIGVGEDAYGIIIYDGMVVDASRIDPDGQTGGNIIINGQGYNNVGQAADGLFNLGTIQTNGLGSIAITGIGCNGDIVDQSHNVGFYNGGSGAGLNVENGNIIINSIGSGTDLVSSNSILDQATLFGGSAISSYGSGSIIISIRILNK